MNQAGYARSIKRLRRRTGTMRVSSSLSKFRTAGFPQYGFKLEVRVFPLDLRQQARTTTPAAALWLPPNVHSDEEALGEIVERHGFTHPRAAISSESLEQMAAYHPKAPHWYLPMIGVGILRIREKATGGALLKYGLEQCDRDHTGRLPGVHQPQKHSSVSASRF